MARHFVLGNGNILVGLDKHARIRDFYYPFVGQENHVAGRIHRFGTWADKTFYWFESPKWEKTLSYKKNSLVTQVHAKNSKLGLELEINDCVHFERNVYLRKLTVKNIREQKQQVKLFFHQNFQLSESLGGDTVYYDPLHHAMVYYKGKRYFMINGGYVRNDKFHGISSYETGLCEIENYEGTYKDVEDGLLNNWPIQHGSVDSTISIEFELEAFAKQDVYYWIGAGSKYRDVAVLDDFVREQSAEKLIAETKNYWSEWSGRTPFNFMDLEDKVVDLFKLSLLIIRAHSDNQGAIIASSDSEMFYKKRDTYAYMWPRDGALIARSLDRSGYQEITENFFQFCCGVLTPDGYFLHKYRPDGSLGSSWHPWLADGKFQLPIQEDQIALILDAQWKHYMQHADEEYGRKMYECFVANAAPFVFNFFDKEIDLPKQSYDLWEENLGIHTFTCATVYAGLLAAAKFEEKFGTPEKKEAYQTKADKLKDAMLKHLYDEEKKTFICRLYYEEGELKTDTRIDASSIYGIFQFKVLPPDDERVVSSIEMLKNKLSVQGAIGGYCRYEGDDYYRVSDDVPGNPWFIISLWLAEYYIACAQSKEDLKPAVEIFEWVADHALETGILSEQMHPHTGEPLSVAPLTWSHAGFVIAINKYLEKLDALGLCEMCNPPKIKDNRSS